MTSTDAVLESKGCMTYPSSKRPDPWGQVGQGDLYNFHTKIRELPGQARGVWASGIQARCAMPPGSGDWPQSWGQMGEADRLSPGKNMAMGYNP